MHKLDHVINNKFDEMIEEKMRFEAENNKDALDAELIQKIPCTDSYTNSISIAVGKQRSGKTRKILKEIIKISKIHKQTHMLVYVNKTGNKTDKTFESLKKLIEVPIVYCSQENCEEILCTILGYKNLYNQIKASGDAKQFPEEDIQDMFEQLGIEDFSRPYLHTLVLLDDIANSPMLAKPTSMMNSLMTQCAHINCSFFLAIQFWKGLPPALKSQVTTIYLFGGFPSEQIHYILRQITLQDPFPIIFEKYKDLDYHDFLYVDVCENYYEIRLKKDN